MNVKMIREPFLLYETLGMVGKYYSKSSFVKTAEVLIGKYGSLLTPSQISDLNSNAMLAEQFTNVVCADLDLDSPDVKFFFKPFDTGRPNELNNVARVLLLSLLGLTHTDFDEQIEETKRRWHRFQEEGVEIVEFTNAGISLMSAHGRPMPTLFEQLYALQYPHEAKMDAFRVLDNFDYYIDKLADLLRPYSMRLKEGMSRLAPIYSMTADYWEHSFKSMNRDQFLELVRVDPENEKFLETSVAVSLFFFNEIGYGYDIVNGSDDEITTIFIGAAVYPEFTKGYSERRADRLADIMKSFSDPIKLEILAKLSKGPDYCLNLAQQMKLNAGNVSRHLTSLYDCGLLLKERHIGRTYYNTDIEAVRHAFEDVEAYILGSNR
ncbi:MAG: winged helix-turn-helix transcriptional regulator [Clostridia bacterium]|nr:winged helix-turn-helix transcriptional regulator [Clostridia bacterium]